MYCLLLSILIPYNIRWNRSFLYFPVFQSHFLYLFLKFILKCFLLKELLKFFNVIVLVKEDECKPNVFLL